MLEFIEYSALSKNNEVSIAALKSFQEILFQSKGHSEKQVEDKEIWQVAWKIWMKIGTEVTQPHSTDVDAGEDVYVPSQAFLTALVQIFPNIFSHIKHNFGLEDLRNLNRVLSNAVSVPVCGETAPYIIPSSSDLTLTPLHDGVLHAMELIQKEIVSRNLGKMLPEIYIQLLVFAKYMCSPPVYNKIDHKQSRTSEWISMNYIPFGEKATMMVVKLYERTAENPEVVSAGILHKIITTLHTPLALKYDCSTSSIWKLAANSLINVLKTGIKVARSHGNQFAPMWGELSSALNDFLFPDR